MRLPGENAFKSMAGSHVPVPVDTQVIVRTGGGSTALAIRWKRDPAAVREDVREALISVASARDDYGVVLRDDLTLDEAGTKRQRDAIRKSRVV